MDRLFTGSAGDRRRFLDRLVLALEPGHAHHAARYEAAMRARNKLLADDGPRRPAWLAALEAADGRAWRGALREARARDRRGARASGSQNAPDDEFARAAIALEGWEQAISPRSFATIEPAMPPRAGRPSARTGRTSPSPTAPSRCPPRAPRPASRRRCCSASSWPMPSWSPSAAASRRSCCSTRSPRISTPKRRAALFARLEGRGQVWMTATEAALFEGIGDGLAASTSKPGTIVAAPD